MWIVVIKGLFVMNEILFIFFCWMYKVKEISILLSFKDIFIK